MKLVTIGIWLLFGNSVQGIERDDPFVFSERKALWKNVLKVTGATRNWARELQDELETSIVHFFQGPVQDIPKLRPPEELLFFKPGKTIAVIYQVKQLLLSIQKI